MTARYCRKRVTVTVALPACRLHLTSRLVAKAYLPRSCPLCSAASVDCSRRSFCCPSRSSPFSSFPAGRSRAAEDRSRRRARGRRVEPSFFGPSLPRRPRQAALPAVAPPRRKRAAAARPSCLLLQGLPVRAAIGQQLTRRSASRCRRTGPRRRRSRPPLDLGTSARRRLP